MINRNQAVSTAGQGHWQIPQAAERCATSCEMGATSLKPVTVTGVRQKSSSHVSGLDDVVIAVIMTCHNRSGVTRRCLESIVACTLPPAVKLKVYLTDDGCSDDTVAMVRKIVPDAVISAGDGSLYWCGGMRLSMSTALEDGADFVLWLNDDVVLEKDSIEAAWRTLPVQSRNVSAHEKPGMSAIAKNIVVGSTVNPETGKLNYGGLKPRGGFKSRTVSVVDPRIESQYEIVDPGKEAECETMAGQFVLIPRAVALEVGEIETAFVHWLGDVDYGYRARALGVRLRLIPKPIGSCPANKIVESWKIPDEGKLSDYWRKMNSIKGLNWKERMIYYKRHAGCGWWLGWLLPYVTQVILFPFQRKVSPF